MRSRSSSPARTSASSRRWQVLRQSVRTYLSLHLHDGCWRGVAIGVALGFLIGLTNTLIPPSPEPNFLALSGFIGTLAYLFRCAIKSMKRGAQLDFQMQNIVLWFGTAVGITVTYPALAADAIGVSLLIGLVAAVVGGIIIRFGPRDDGA